MWSLNWKFSRFLSFSPDQNFIFSNYLNNHIKSVRISFLQIIQVITISLHFLLFLFIKRFGKSEFVTGSDEQLSLKQLKLFVLKKERNMNKINSSLHGSTISRIHKFSYLNIWKLEWLQDFLNQEFMHESDCSMCPHFFHI